MATIKDSDILNAMQYHIDMDSMVYGATPHYAVGAYYDKTKVSSVLGDKDYNAQSNVDDASGTTAAKDYIDGNGIVKEELLKAKWLKEF